MMLPLCTGGNVRFGMGVIEHRAELVQRELEGVKGSCSHLGWSLAKSDYERGEGNSCI
jgi:hypothetical protein